MGDIPGIGKQEMLSTASGIGRVEEITYFVRTSAGICLRRCLCGAVVRKVQGRGVFWVSWCPMCGARRSQFYYSRYHHTPDWIRTFVAGGLRDEEDK